MRLQSGGRGPLGSSHVAQSLATQTGDRGCDDWRERLVHDVQVARIQLGLELTLRSLGQKIPAARASRLRLQPFGLCVWRRCRHSTALPDCSARMGSLSPRHRLDES